MRKREKHIEKIETMKNVKIRGELPALSKTGTVFWRIST